MANSFAGRRQPGVLDEGPESEALPEFAMPQMFDIAGRRPVRLRWLYNQLERAGSSLHQMFHAWGTTAEERSMSFPCDSHVSPPLVSQYRGVDVLAPKEIVYRWLCQIRVAPYSYDWFDNFGRQSPRQLTPGLERLAVGQPLLVMFRIVDFVENEHITVLGETFEWIAGQKLAMTYLIVPRTSTSCRLISKITGRHGPLTYLNRLRREYAPIGEFPLMRKQLLTMKRLAEKQFLEELADGRRRLADDSASDTPAQVGG
jgi:hypothetical protein